MISRCPCCAAQVPEEAQVCPSCRWDFALRRRADETPAASSAPKELPAAIARLASPPLELSHFADDLGRGPQPVPPPRKALTVAPAPPAAVPAPAAKPREKAQPPAPEARPRPRRRRLPAVAGAAAVCGMAVVGLRALLTPPPPAAPPAPVAIPFPPDRDALKLPAAPAPPAKPKATAAVAKPAPAPAPVLAKPSGAPPQNAAVSAPAPRASRPAPARWIFSGQAYDVLSLRPVSFAQLTFRDPSGADAGEVSTGADGRFSIVLAPVAGGYRLKVSHPDYKDRYLDDVTPSMRLTSRSLRRQLLKALPQNDPWIAGKSGAMRRDIVLLPKAE